MTLRPPWASKQKKNELSADLTAPSAVDAAGMNAEAETTDTPPVAHFEADTPAATMDESADTSDSGATGTDTLETARDIDGNTPEPELPPAAPSAVNAADMRAEAEATDTPSLTHLETDAPAPARPRRATPVPLTPEARIFLDVVTHALQAGESVPLPGLGALTVRSQPARTGRHPRSGKVIQIPAKSRVHFKQASSLRQRLNPEA